MIGDTWCILTSISCTISSLKIYGRQRVKGQILTALSMLLMVGMDLMLIGWATNSNRRVGRRYNIDCWAFVREWCQTNLIRNRYCLVSVQLSILLKWMLDGRLSHIKLVSRRRKETLSTFWCRFTLLLRPMYVFMGIGLISPQSFNFSFFKIYYSRIGLARI